MCLSWAPVRLERILPERSEREVHILDTVWLSMLTVHRRLVPIVNLPYVQRWLTYQTSQLWVSYRRAPLAERSLPSRKPRPGDRVPDLPCTRVDGVMTRLHAELRGHWALVLPDGKDMAIEETARKHLGDKVVSLRRDDPADSDVLLVRPDGHLAWRGRRPVGMQRWLHRALEVGRVR